jgi:hypothetical protein
VVPNGDDEVARAIRRVAAGENPLGVAFPADDIEDLMAGMILFAPHSGDDQVEPDAETLDLLGRLGSRAGVVADDEQHATAQKVAAYLSAHPPDPVLVDAIVAALAALIEQGAIDKGSSFARFVGNAASNRPVGGPAPPGSVTGGLNALLEQRTRKD